MNHEKTIMILLIVILAILIAGTIIVNPFRSDSRLSLTSPNEITEGDNLSVMLTDVNSRPIANQNISIYITDSNGVVTQKSVTTNQDGAATISSNDLTSGSYDVNASYGGSFAFKASHTSQSLTVNPKVTESISTDTVTDAPYHPGFTPSYREGPLVYGYKGSRWGFVTPAGNFFEM